MSREQCQACFDVQTQRCVCPMNRDEAIKALAPEMREMLLELEWSLAVVTMNGTLMTCPVCNAFQDKGFHLPWCQLATLLGKLR